MLGFLKKLFGVAETTPPQAPYKVETPVAPVSDPAPAKCGCGRSQSGLCVGLHKLTPEEWATHTDNPNKTPVAKAPAKKQQFEKKPVAPKAAAKPKAPSKPRAPQKTTAK